MIMTDPSCSTFHLLAMKFPTFFGRAELYFFFPALSLSFSRFYRPSCLCSWRGALYFQLQSISVAVKS